MARKLGDERLQEMTTIVSKCIIRRTSALLTKYLPVSHSILWRDEHNQKRLLQVKYELVLCCKLTDVQEAIYRKIINGKARDACEKEANKGAGKQTLSFIMNLKKLCNHPQLIYKHCVDEDPGYQGMFGRCIGLYSIAKLLLSLGCAQLYPPSFNPKKMDPSHSGKMKVLDYLLAVTRKNTDDRFVLVSNYTETLDSFIEVC